VELLATAAAVAVDRLRFLRLWSRKLDQADAAHSQLLRYADDLRTTFTATRRRHRPGALHHQAAGRDARRLHLGGVVAGDGLGVRLHPADLGRAGREPRHMKLLIADDEQAVRALVHVTLEGDDYGILEAADGLEALEVARDESPSLVLLDIMMPRLDGLEVCRQRKSDPDTRDIVVVMLTAQAQDRDRDRDQGLAAGADDYFTKPFSPLALLNMVERVRQTQSQAG
jgi:two-component system phosphate regulon response regulator PhoB